ncbi:MAG: alpha/beta hydrolase [Lachnospiraceae bacterium]|nr:alpha/beta hydrolase [Lachnospiraceae bacterium]
MKEEFFYPSQDGRTGIHALRYLPETAPRAILQIAHGMTEFIKRYEEFAQFLNKRGIIVTGNDHLGHGNSVISEEDYGFFAKKKGNQILLKDMHELTRITRKAYPHLPYFLLGHSMGSFYARQYLFTYGNELTGAIISGTGHQPPAMVWGGMATTGLMTLFKGSRYRSPFVDKMTFGSYNKRIHPLRTEKDWLTRDTAIVDTYLADKRCTFLFTLNAFHEMFLGISRLYSRNNLKKMPSALPVLFISGTEDPVGDYTRGVHRAADSFLRAGMKQVEVKFYEGDRHEVLNELDRLQVYADLARWMEQILEAGRN